jgi:hypothetical protein
MNSYSQSTSENSKKKKIWEKQNIFAQVKFDYGGVHPELKEEGIPKYYGLDLRIAFQNKETSIYSTIYRAPKFGLGFYSGAFGSNAFGEPNGLYGFFESPIGKQRKRLNWVYSIGFGLAFNFNYFDPENNPENGLLGSSENVYFSLAFEGRYNITKHWVAGLGLGFKHFSNGRYRQPNHGVNLVPITITTEYNFGDLYTHGDKEKLPKFIPFNMINIFAAGGIRQFVYGEALYFKSTLNVSALRQISYRLRFGVGFDIFYTAGSLDRVTDDKSNFNKQFSYGFAALMEWVITERLYVPVNYGIFVNYNVENLEELLYARLGLRYLIGKQKKTMVGIGLKITPFHADYTEVTIGYTFKKDKNKYELLF